MLTRMFVWLSIASHFLSCMYINSNFNIVVAQANVKLNEQQLASLSSPKAVDEYLESQKENILNVIKQNLAVGDIYKRENLQVFIYIEC